MGGIMTYAERQVWRSDCRELSQFATSLVTSHCPTNSLADPQIPERLVKQLKLKNLHTKV